MEKIKIQQDHIKAYKLKELAKKEGVHYQTVIKRNLQNKYLQVLIPVGEPDPVTGELKHQIRYLDLWLSNLIRQKQHEEKPKD